jgi:hypothetical protein
LHSVYPAPENAWFHSQPLKLKCDFLVSKFALKWVNVHRYPKVRPEEVELVRRDYTANGGALQVESS